MKMETLKREVTEAPKLFGNVLGALLAIALTSIGLMLAYDWLVPVVVIKDQRLTAKEVTAGEPICAVFMVDRYRNCPAVVYQWIFDGGNNQQPVAPLLIPARPLVQGDTIPLCVTVPRGATPGYARYQMSYTHTCEVIDGIWVNTHTTALPYMYFTIREPSREQQQKAAQ